MSTIAAGLFLMVSGFALTYAGLRDNARAAGWGYTAVFAAGGCLLIGEFF